MYDFLLSEEYWMETIIAALITAVASLLLALLAVGPKLNALGEKAASNKEAAQHNKEQLSKEHGSIQNSIADLKRPLEFLRDAQMKEDARRETVKGQTLDMQKMLDILSAQQRYVQELEQKVQSLEAENQRLRDRLGLADELVRQPRREPDRDRDADEQEL